MIPKDVIKSAGLNYEWYVDEAISIVRELKKGRVDSISEAYIEEKISNVRTLFSDLRNEESRNKGR